MVRPASQTRLSWLLLESGYRGVWGQGSWLGVGEEEWWRRRRMDLENHPAQGG